MRTTIRRKYLVYLERKCLCSKLNLKKLFWSKWRRMKKVCDKYIQPKAQYKVLIKPRILALWKSYHFYLILGLESLISDFYFPLQVRVLLHRAVIGSYVEYWLKRSALNMLVVIDRILWWIWYLMDPILWWIWYLMDLILWWIWYCDGSDNVMDLIMTKRVTLSCFPLLPQSASQTILIVDCNEKGIKGSDHHRLIGGILIMIESAQNMEENPSIL